MGRWKGHTGPCAAYWKWPRWKPVVCFNTIGWVCTERLGQLYRTLLSSWACSWAKAGPIDIVIGTGSHRHCNGTGFRVRLTSLALSYANKSQYRNQSCLVHYQAATHTLKATVPFCCKLVWLLFRMLIVYLLTWNNLTIYKHVIPRPTLTTGYILRVV